MITDTLWTAHAVPAAIHRRAHQLVHHARHGDTTIAQFDRRVNVHFKGVFFLAQALLPVIRDGGCIMNISTCPHALRLSGVCRVGNGQNRGGEAGPVHGRGTGPARHRGRYRRARRD
ncbi:hypothetical protein [Luteimonas deserti]|uniref:SDR family NAD(P)-dependent oxidoreductase n=1 Tax=Luteimonas deserti TaxID=2752306 RepID=A0A7Z0QU16_9GAMM|nr:hypothetical protein [Luteimonas deserti]NYZ63040.1 hypothetical protein [Luteimonas deserti]